MINFFLLFIDNKSIKLNLIMFTNNIIMPDFLMIISRPCLFFTKNHDFPDATVTIHEITEINYNHEINIKRSDAAKKKIISSRVSLY